MTDPLLTIGAFARAVGLTPSALRHYDECGLLPPAEVDHDTGYRYYTPDLARRAVLIAGMRDAGVPIDTMGVVLNDDIGEARRVLRAYVQDQAAKAARAEAAVEQVLATLEADAGPSDRTRATLAGPGLAAAIRQVRPAADHDATSALSSILLDIADETVDIVATNRFWMAVRTLPVTAAGSTGRIVLGVPDAMDLATRLDATDEVTLEITDRELAVAGSVVAGRDVAYPAHRMVVDGLDPKRTTAVLPRSELAQAIEAVGRSEITLALSGKGSRVTAGGDGPAEEVAGTVHGEDVTVRLGRSLMLRGLATALGSEVALELAASDRPMVIRSPYQGGFVVLIMPIGQG